MRDHELQAALALGTASAPPLSARTALDRPMAACSPRSARERAGNALGGGAVCTEADANAQARSPGSPACATHANTNALRRPHAPRYPLPLHEFLFHRGCAPSDPAFNPVPTPPHPHPPTHPPTATLVTHAPPNPAPARPCPASPGLPPVRAYGSQAPQLPATRLGLPQARGVARTRTAGTARRGHALRRGRRGALPRAAGTRCQSCNGWRCWYCRRHRPARAVGPTGAEVRRSGDETQSSSPSGHCCVRCMHVLCWCVCVVVRARVHVQNVGCLAWRFQASPLPPAPRQHSHSNLWVVPIQARYGSVRRAF
jgi:hypothetical protein